MSKQIKIEDLENLLFKATRNLGNGEEIVINNCTTCAPFPFRIVAYKNDEGRTTFIVISNYGNPEATASEEEGSSGFHIKELIQDVFNSDELEMAEIDNCGIWVNDSELESLNLLESKKLEEKSSYNALRDILKDDTLSSTSYTETNEGIEITFSLGELKGVTGMNGVEAIKYLFHIYGCDEEFIELAEEEEFITIEFPYTHKNLTESEEYESYSELSEYQKDLIKEIVQADFEMGHPQNYEGALEGMEDDEDLAPVAEAAADYYMELVEMGPAGIMDEIETGWSQDYENEYAEKDVSLSNNSTTDINGCADWYKISQIESLMYMNKGMTPRDAKKELGIDPSFEYVPTGHLDESVKNKNKRLREAITKKAKEKLNLLNDIVNFAYEYGEEATKALFQQAFKKVTGDDLIDALDEDK